MLRASVVIAALVAVTLSGCRAGEDEVERPQAEGAQSDSARVVTGSVGRSVPYVLGNRLYGIGAEVRLRSAARAPLAGMLTPVAVAAPDGGTVVYNAWRGRRPLLRLYDVGRKQDSVLDDGAFSVAWRSDGALAYVKAVRPDVGDPRLYVGHVVVRKTSGSAPSRWTTRPGRYVVAAWAGRSVLAYRLGAGWPDLLAVDGPGRVRVLSKASALVALSADGRRAFVSRYGSSPPVVAVVDVESGAELARRRVRRPAIGFVLESGAWTGDLVVAPVSGGVGVFRVGGGGIALEQVLRLGGDAAPAALLEPRIDRSGRIVAWGELPAGARQAVTGAAAYACDRVELRCVRFAQGTADRPPRPVYNPSRP